jgi:NAD-dependent DNA ligase
MAPQIVTITGELPIPRKQVVAAMQRRCMTYSRAVTRKTSLLVVGDAPGDRLAQAARLNIKTIDGAAFLRTLTA